MVIIKFNHVRSLRTVPGAGWRSKQPAFILLEHLINSFYKYYLEFL